MDVHFVEATNGPRNWGKFAVCKFSDQEWRARSALDGQPLLAARGWSRRHTLVIDLQTGEGAFFPEWVHASDLAKHQIWVCPMFEHALKAILDGQHDPMTTDALLDFPDAPFEFAGYRRGGPRQQQLEDAARAVVEQWASGAPDDVSTMTEAIERLRDVLGDPE